MMAKETFVKPEKIESTFYGKGLTIRVSYQDKKNAVPVGTAHESNESITSWLQQGPESFWPVSAP
jgi:hypothetical protein